MSGITTERTPQRDRGQRTKTRLVEAASSLLAEHGYEGFTLTEVARRAGVSYGSTYWYFADKDALLTAVHERMIATLGEQIDELAATDWGDAPPVAVVEGIIRGLGRIYAREPALLRAMSLRGGSDPAILERTAPPFRDLGERLHAILAPRLAAAGHPEPEQAADDLFLMAVAVLAAWVTWPIFFARATLSYERLVDRLVEMAVADVEAKLRDGP